MKTLQLTQVSKASKDLIRAVRNARAEVNVAPSKPITILVKTSDSDLKPSLTAMSTTSNASQIQNTWKSHQPSLHLNSLCQASSQEQKSTCHSQTSSMSKKKLARLDKELAKWQKELDMVGKKLSNERFVANAKPEVVQKERDKQADYQAKYDATVERIDEMKKLVK